MKKKYILFLLVVLLIGCLILVSAKVINDKRKNNELEAVQIFEKRATVNVTVEDSYENIDEIQKNIQNMKFVKNVIMVSKEDKVEDLKNKFDNNELFDNEDLFKGIPVSFIIQFDINSADDFEEIKTIEDNLININGIDKVEADGCKEIIKIYETIGIKGLKEYDKIYTIMDEQGVNGVTTYLDEHPNTRELLKDLYTFKY